MGQLEFSQLSTVNLVVTYELLQFWIKSPQEGSFKKRNPQGPEAEVTLLDKMTFCMTQSVKVVVEEVRSDFSTISLFFCCCGKLKK